MTRAIPGQNEKYFFFNPLEFVFGHDSHHFEISIFNQNNLSWLQWEALWNLYILLPKKPSLLKHYSRVAVSLLC